MDSLISIRPLLHALSLLNIVQALTHDFFELSYGNELQRVNHYFDEIVPKYSSLNITKYNHDVSECGLKRLLDCQSWTNRGFEDSSRLWEPKFVKNRRPTPDSNFTVTFVGSLVSDGYEHASSWNNGQLRFCDFVFDIREVCTNVSQALGGATFEFFAYTEQSLATCSSVDHFDGSYTFRCSTPIAPSPSNLMTEIPNCLHLTVLLEHQHYDAWNPVLDFLTAYYPPAFHTVVDNVTFCGPRLEIHNDTPRTDVETKEIDIVSSISLYSGLWLRQYADAVPANESGACNVSVMDSIKRCQHLDAHISLSEYHCPRIWTHNPSHSDDMELLTSTAQNRLDSPSLWVNRRGCFNEAVTYKGNTNRLLPVDKVAPMVANSSLLPLQYSFHPIKQFLAKRRRRFDIKWVIPRYGGIGHLQNTTHSHVTFIGASHIRYVMASIVEHLVGKEVIRDWPRKEDSMIFNNFRYIQVQYANDLVPTIMSLCGTQKTPTTIVFQTGDWDLTVGLSRVMRDPRYSRAVSAFMKKLLEGSYPCAPVIHVVYVTAVPYPQCLADGRQGMFPLACQAQRGFRTNSAIAALNSYYIDEYTKINVHPSKKLSIVDAFSIIQPRILMNENTETGCINHFACLVFVDENQPTQRTELIYGQSGLAMVQAIMHALSL
jgi:hypothetical protein